MSAMRWGRVVRGISSAALLSALAAACGGEDASPGSQGTTGTGAAASTGGASGTGGVGSGTGGGSSTQPTPPTTVPSVSCDAGDWDVSGTLHGAPFQATGDMGLGAFFSRSASETLGAETEPLVGALYAPNSALGAGFFCVDEGSLQEGVDEEAVALIGHFLAGSCAGATPVEGSLDYCESSDPAGCDGSSPESTPTLNGTLEGVSVSDAEREAYAAGPSGVTARAPGYDFTLDYAEMLYFGSTVSVSGLLFAKAGSPLAGGIYCFTGSATSAPGGTSTRFHFDALAKIGSCADSGPTDTLTGCIGC